MTMNEKKLQSIKKELEKKNGQLQKHEALLEKKVAKCEKLNCNWNRNEWFEHRETATLDQEKAWFAKSLEEDEIAELNRSIAYNNKKLEKLMGIEEKEEANKASENRNEQMGESFENFLKMSREEAEAEYQKWLKEFKAECLKDGVVIEEADSNRVYGLTKSGKKFYIYINNGLTERSRHCYTLRVAGKTEFTSGDFATAYKNIK